jgi:hypothetical protein
VCSDDAADVHQQQQQQQQQHHHENKPVWPTWAVVEEE